MSLDGQVLCQRMLTGPCALATLGAAIITAPATTAPLRNLRRDGLPLILVGFISSSRSMGFLAYGRDAEKGSAVFRSYPAHNLLF
jgi:hypothetical protein